jgi:cytochrome c
MSDPTGRDPEERLPATRPPSEPAPVERFAAPPSAHQLALTAERAAQVVRQSGNARWVGFLTVLVVVLFTIAYWFYELGIPGVANSSRLTKETEAQSVTSVERGYNLFQANCARCHGPRGHRSSPQRPDEAGDPSHAAVPQQRAHGRRALRLR